MKRIILFTVLLLMTAMVSAEQSTITVNGELSTTKAGIIFETNMIQDVTGTDLYFLGFFEKQNNEMVMLWADNGRGGIFERAAAGITGACSEAEDSFYDQKQVEAVAENEYCLLTRDRRKYVSLTITTISEDYSSLTIDWQLGEVERTLSEEEERLLAEEQEDDKDDDVDREDDKVVESGEGEVSGEVLGEDGAKTEAMELVSGEEVAGIEEESGSSFDNYYFLFLLDAIMLLLIVLLFREILRPKGITLKEAALLQYRKRRRSRTSERKAGKKEVTRVTLWGRIEKLTTSKERAMLEKKGEEMLKWMEKRRKKDGQSK